jgi:DNA-binding beta-propeller fold protein YncE
MATPLGATPLRIVRDPYASFSAVAVDVARNQVIAADENLFQILVYDRRANTAASADRTVPLRVLGGPGSAVEYVAALAVAQPSGEIYATHGDTTTMLVFSAGQQADVPPLRQLQTPKARGIVIAELQAEVILTSQHESAVLAYPQLADGDAPPVRVLQGDRTGLANPHGIALDAANDLIFVANHGQVSSRAAAARPPAERPALLTRDDAVLGSGRFLDASITVHRRTDRGDAPPVRVIQGPRTRLNWPAGLVFDPARRELFVANDMDHSILVFRGDAAGDVPPLRVLNGPRTGLRYPAGVFVDGANGELWVANYGNHALTVYDAAASGDTPPRRTIRSGPSGSEALMIGNPGALAYDTKREQILVPN